MYNTFYHIINYQHVSIAFALIIRVDFKLPNCITRNTQRCNRCFQLSIWPQYVSLYIIKTDKI